MNGTTLGNFRLFNKFDYLIEINAPFIERQGRIIKRKDEIFDKEIIVNRDIDFKESKKKGRRKGKISDKVIQNIGTKEDLQKIANEIYYEQIEGRSVNNVETIQEKYGGYEVKPITRTQQLKADNIKKDDLSK